MIQGLRAPIADAALVRVGMLGPRQSSNGQLQVLRHADAIDASSDLVLKTRQQGGAQDAFAWDVARAFDIEDMFLRTEWSDAHQGALMERFDGRTLSDRRLNGASGLRTGLEGYVRAQHPALGDSAVEASVRGRTERLMAAKAFLADGDWHEMNVLQSSNASKRLAMIDHGLMNQYRPTEDGVPTIKSNFAAGLPERRTSSGVHELPLSPTTLASLERVDRRLVDHAFPQLVERAGGSIISGRRFAEPLSLSQLPEMWARLDDAIAREAVRFRVI